MMDDEEDEEMPEMPDPNLDGASETDEDAMSENVEASSDGSHTRINGINRA
jgi:hypothetical protein